MNTPELIAVAGLVAIFAIAMWRSLNMGAVALVAAFALGVGYFDLEVGDIAKGFPGSLFVTLLGVTYLFGIARANGTVDAIVGSAVHLVRGRVAMIPWVFFVLAAIITGAGALSAATNAILIPVGLAFAYRYKISPLLVGLSVLNGTNAGGFSPISVYFNIVDEVFGQSGISLDPAPIFFFTFAANLVLNLAAFFMLGGTELLRRGKHLVDSPDDDTSGSPTSGTALAVKTVTWTTKNVLTVTLLVGIVALALGFTLDVGFLALTAAVVLAALYPQDSKRAFEQIGWGVILLIGGIVTYISVLQSAGVVDNIAASVATIGAPLVAALTILFVAGVVSAFASTNAMFVVLVPLAAPLVLAGDVSTLGFVVALCIAASAVDSSPFSTGGALIIANTEEHGRDRTFRGLLIWGMSMIVFAPVASWLLFVLPT
ncbi:SLC13 family permease [Rhodococcus sp. IEGM 1330]|uniref:SLC13 family permease n=1 Tax=Rhodococcus sp. IEGM 1330 TaxID=3082225 RepID=UPI00295371E2|nr:SLC13 family permease [Rhodococcus sp. IEGM 1330]MDV8024655.1 SLC13 family permease [Rhodococcus sp. IEGM 1330]